MAENDSNAEKKPARRARKGSGSVYRPTYKKAGALAQGGWRIRYRWNGKTYDKAVPADRPNSKAAAQEFLKQCFAAHASGEYVEAGAEKLRYRDLRDGLLRHYEVNGLKSLKTARDGKTRYLSGQSNLDKFFAEWNPRALDINTGTVERFKQERLQAGDSNANISASVRLLRRMFNIVIEEGRFSAAHKPRVKMPKEHAPRKGFLEPADFRKLHDALPADLRPAVMLGFDTGMRLAEVQHLRWQSLDLTGKGEIRLSAEETKTSVARTIPLGRMLEILRIMRAKRPNDLYVFGGNQPLGSFRKRLYHACVNAGLGEYLCAECSGPMVKGKCTMCSSGRRKYKGLTFHDLRRSAVRNLVRSGVPEAVAMSISGHRTREVFDRYNITSTDDLHEAARRRDEYVEATIVQRQSKDEAFGEPDEGTAKPLTQ